MAADNTTRMCGRCLREFGGLDKPPAGLTKEFFSTPEMCAALDANHMGKVFKAYRQHERFVKLLGRPLSQEEFGRWLGLSQTAVSRIEGAKPEENLGALRKYAAALHIPNDLLWFDFPGENRASRAFQDAACSGKSADSFEWESPAAIAERATAFAASSSDSVIELTRIAVTDVMSRYEAEGPSKLVAEALKIRKTTQEVLDGWIHPAKRDEIVRLAAQSAALLGYMAVNAGKFNVAKAYCAEGEMMASVANDVDLMMWVRGTQSFCAYYEKDYVKAAEIARSGIALDPTSPQAIRLRSNGEARALGMLGQRDEAASAISDGARLLDAIADDSEILDSCISFSPYGYARFAANAATAWVPLGNLDRVVQYIGEIDTAVEEADSNWSRVLTRLDIATAALIRNPPDLEQAASFGITALRKCGKNPIQSIRQRAATLRDIASQWIVVPVIREFIELHNAWSKSNAAQ
ncbi:helix-turn-helix transcriptional regulator [Lentzea guizhouensis]|uniref:helix-turn-helix transcriptional regulator n=1 Tax=Lentzea guizhouensis TaxID=1586287 RepID=UPI0012B68E29|nr:helix-turn-helix domain-containing protein [Lentzea guizhouensis]